MPVCVWARASVCMVGARVGAARHVGSHGWAAPGPDLTRWWVPGGGGGGSLPARRPRLSPVGGGGDPLLHTTWAWHGPKGALLYTFTTLQVLPINRKLQGNEEHTQASAYSKKKITPGDDFNREMVACLSGKNLAAAGNPQPQNAV